MVFAAAHESAPGRLCCKSLFAPLIANFSSCRRGFRVNMWGTSSPGDKLTGDFGNEPDATSISDRGLFRLLAGNLSPGVFRLLQHNRHTAAPDATARQQLAKADTAFQAHPLVNRLNLAWPCPREGRHPSGLLAKRFPTASLALWRGSGWQRNPRTIGWILAHQPLAVALPPIATGVATLRICAMSRHRRAIRLLRRLALASSPVRPIRLLLPPLG